MLKSFLRFLLQLLLRFFILFLVAWSNIFMPSCLFMPSNEGVRTLDTAISAFLKLAGSVTAVADTLETEIVDGVEDVVEGPKASFLNKIKRLNQTEMCLTSLSGTSRP